MSHLTRGVLLLAIELVSSRAVAQSQLIRDIKTGSTAEVGGDPRQLMTAGTWTYFVQESPMYGRELWRTDGTTAGTQLAKDVLPGGASADPFLLGFAGQWLLFVAPNAKGGSDLWRSDGTAAGTSVVHEFAIAPTFDHLYSPSASLGGLLVFSTLEGQLWRTDGTAQGTVFLVQFEDGGAGMRPVSTEELVFFVANDNVSGFELWKTDGTAAGTVLVTDLAPGMASSRIGELEAVGTLAYFTADGRLWRSDGSANGTFALLQGLLAPNALYPVAGRLFFTNDRQLWRTDGTLAGTIELAQVVPNTEQPGDQGGAELDGRLLLLIAGSPLQGGTDTRRLWMSDGTPTGTIQRTEIAARPAVGADAPRFTSCGSAVYFTADQLETGRELWRSDGTAAGTGLVLDVLPGQETYVTRSASSSPGPLACLGGALLFGARDSSGGRRLWRSDGTAAGTERVQDILSVSSSPRDGVRLWSTHYFTAEDDEHGRELWRSDGTSTGTTLVADLCPGPCSSSPWQLTVSGEALYFVANDGTHGEELWRCKGDELDSVRETLHLASAGVESLPWPRDLADFDGRLYFTTGTSAYDRSFWRTDGTAAGTALLSHYGLERGDLASPRPSQLTSAGRYVYLVQGGPGIHSDSLLRSDGTAAGTIVCCGSDTTPTDPEVQLSWPSPSWITITGQAQGWLFYTTSTLMSGGNITSSGQRTDGRVSVPDGWGCAHASGAMLYCGGWQPGLGVGRELYVTDSVSTAPHLLMDVCPGSCSSDPADFTDVNGTLFFTADDGVHGRELWRSDGTEEGTGLVRDIRPGAASSGIEGLFATGSEAFFTADDGMHGQELWKSDGFRAGTRMVEDLGPGPLGGPVRNLVSTVYGLFFSPWDESIGYELRLLPSVPIYRLYSAVTMEHLMTTDPWEDRVLGGRGWTREGTGFRLLPTTRLYAGVTPAPLFRLYHAGIRQHLWTTDANEYDVLGTRGWTREGISGFLLATEQPGTVPLWRMVHASLALHLWTTDANEHQVLQGRNWISEGVIGYVVP